MQIPSHTGRRLAVLLLVLVPALTPVVFGQVPNLPHALPSAQAVTEGRSVSFHADNMSGVQWQIAAAGSATWSNLADNDTYHGTATMSLDITGATAAMSNSSYRFTSTAGGITLTSNAVRLTVSPLLFPMPTRIILDQAGGLLVSDAVSQTIRRIANARFFGWDNDVACVAGIYAGTNGVAGNVNAGGGPGSSTFSQPGGMAPGLLGDPIREMLVADTANGLIRLISGDQIRNLSGSSSARGNVDGVAAVARFAAPTDIARGIDGSYYVTDATNHTIRRVTADGTVSTIAGSPGNAGSTDGIGSAARFNNPTGIAVDQHGTLYVADTTNNLIRKITPAGEVTTLAGVAGIAGAQDGTGAGALFNGPAGVATYGSRLFVADTGNSSIREIQTASGTVTTYAGVPGLAGLRDGRANFFGDLSGGPGRDYFDALFNQPKALAADEVGGQLYIADTGNAAIRMIAMGEGVTMTIPVVDTPVAVNVPANPPPAAAPAPVSSSPSSGGGSFEGVFIAAVAGLGLLRLGRRSLGRTLLPAVMALSFGPLAFGQAPANYVYVLPDRQCVTEGRNVSFIATGISGAIQWQVSTNGGTVFSDLAESSAYVGTKTKTLEIVGAVAAMNKSLIRFTYTLNGVTTPSNVCVFTVSPAFFPMPSGIAADYLGNLYLSDDVTHTVWKGLIVPVNLYPNGLPLHLALSALAGNSGQAGTADGKGPAAQFSHPAGVAVNAAGLVAIADSANGTIRQISAAGVVSTLAGSTASRGNVDGSGAAARFSTPLGIAQNPDGSYFVADAANHTIRRVAADGTVTTFAGSPGNAGYADGAGAAARFNHPEGVAVDQAGQVYVADTVNNLIRLITPAGVVSTVAGVPGIAGAQDGDPGLATFNAPAGVAVSRNGRWVFVADTGNSTIRFILDPRRLYNGPPPEVRTYAGIPTVSGERDGYDGLLDHPKAIAVDNADDYYQIHVYIADTGNAAIRLASFDNGLETIPLTNGPTTFLETPFSAPATTSDSSSGTGSPVASSAAATTSSSSGGGAFGGQFVLILAGLLLLRRRRATD